MASLLREAQYLSVYWHHAEKDNDAACVIAEHVTPEMLEHPGIQAAYRILRERYARGAPILGDRECALEMRGALGNEWFTELWEDHHIGGRALRWYASEILLDWRRREQERILREAAQASLEADPQKSYRLAEEAIADLMRLHHASHTSRSPQNKAEHIARQREWMEGGSESGLSWPWQALGDELGDALPGDFISVAGYSNSGKSLFLGALFNHFTRTHPCLVYPTEMGGAWLSRALAAETGVPQRIAERRQWALATPEQRAAYEFALHDYEKAREWEIVNRRRISPQQIMARGSILRRRWPGRTVVVMVDHMHRLDYGGVDPDVGVGEWTPRLRDWAAEDEDGGMILVLLYQPRKPLDEIELYKAVMGYQVRGKSAVWNEADIMLSPYRRWVRCDQSGLYLTPWGTPACLYTSKGLPEFTKPGDEQGKIDDEHMYLKAVKRRVGGEGPTVVLDVDYPSGRLTKSDLRHGPPVRVGPADQQAPKSQTQERRRMIAMG